jgi:hypothetical protein
MVRATSTGQVQRHAAPVTAGTKGVGANRSGRMATEDNPAPVDPVPIRRQAFLPLPGTSPVPLEETGDKCCRWPVGERPSLFCNEPAQIKPTKGKPIAGAPVVYFPYCEAHQRLSTAKR